MNKAEIDAVRAAVTEVFNSLSGAELRELLASSYVELREETSLLMAA